MTRRRRIRLTIILLALGIPLVLASLVVFYVGTGRVGSLLAVEYARVMPGQLSVGSLRFTAADQVHLTDVSIREGFAAPLFTAAAIDAKLDIFNGQLKSLTLRGCRMRLDEDSFGLLQRIIEAGEKLPPSNPPQKWELIAEGEAEFSSGLVLTELSCSGRITGSLFEISGTGRIGADKTIRSFKTRVAGRLMGQPVSGVTQQKRISVFLDDIEGPLPEALAAVSAIGLLPPASPGLVRWLPRVIDASGSVVHRDLGLGRFVVPAKVRWNDPQGRPGAVEAEMVADRDQIAVGFTRIEDPALGRITGTPGRTSATLDIDLRKKIVGFEAPRFAPGPGLGIPPAVSLEALLRQTPRLKLTYDMEHGETAIRLSGPEQSKAQLGLTWAPDRPIRIEANEMPLTIAQGFMPEGMSLAGGQLSTLAVTLQGGSLADAKIDNLQVTVDQARGTWRGWSAGPFSGTLTVVPQGADGTQIDAILPLGTISAAGSIATGTAKLRLKSVDGVLARLHGPVTLPGVTGGLEIDLGWNRTAANSLVLEVPRATLDRSDVTYEGRELLQGMHTTVKGTVTVSQSEPGTPALIAIKTGGQLTAGALRVPGSWLDLATRTPIFTLAAEVRTGATAQFTLSELLVRAADAAGTPQPEGYSAQFNGTIDHTGAGVINGLVDHANLGWADRALKLPTNAVDGEGAVTCLATFVDARMERLTGSFLPLNAEVQLGTKFRASGITGAVEFTLDRATVEK